MSLATHKKHTRLQQLKRLLWEQGCFEPRLEFYVNQLIGMLAIFMVNIAVLLLVDSFSVQIVNAIVLGLVFAQLAMLVHDIIHQQAWKSGLIHRLLGGLILGMSGGWWQDKHNQKHHRYPNQIGLDQDIEAPLLAFTQEQATNKKGFENLAIPYQFYYVILMLILVPFYMSGESLYFLKTHKVKRKIIDIALIFSHFLLFFMLLYISDLNIYQSLIFFFLSKGVFGGYIGSVFIINHTGMPVFNKGDDIDFLWGQVTSSRNVKAHPFTDVMMCGINAQIEHHLFPQMPRPHLNKARVIVKQFCAEHDIPYHETGFLEAFQETWMHLKTVSSFQS